MNKGEMLRLQGMDPTKLVVDVPEAALGQLIGNAMSLNVIERVLFQTLHAIRHFDTREEIQRKDRLENKKRRTIGDILVENGVTEVILCVTHGIFSGPAIQRMNESKNIFLVYIIDKENYYSYVF